MEGVYGVEVTDQNGCNADVLVTIQNQTATLVATANSTNISCFGLCDGSASITLNGGASPYDLVWVNAQNVTVHTDNNINAPSTASGLCAGSYTINFNDANNCQGSVSLQLTEPSEIIISLNTETICFGESANLLVDASGGTGAGYTFSWLPAGTGNTQSVSVSPQQTTQYSVTVTDGSACSEGPLNVTVTVSPPLLVEANANPASICFGETTQISVAVNGGVAPFNYTWQPAGSAANQSSFTATPNATTVYSVEVTDACSNVPVTDDVIVTVNNLPNILISASPQQGCQPLDVVFTNNTANTVNCQWDFGNGQIAADCGPDITQLYPDTGCYTISLSVTDANGCSNSAQFDDYVCVQEAPQAFFTASPQPTDLFNSEIFFTDLSDNAADTWLWDFDGLGFSNLQNPSFVFPDTGCYEVLLTINTPANCPASDTQLVCINPPYAVYFPNSFSPNDDGVNDVFSPKGEGIFSFELWIYDRWGELVFFTNSINNTWDGQKIKGNAVCQDDVYAWRANVVDISYRQYNFKGRVTLLR
jgi:gliding motility-associated-like protein